MGAYLHGGKVRCGLRARELELLDDVRDLLEAMNVVMRAEDGVRDDEESGALEEDQLVRLRGHGAWVVCE